MNDRNLMALKAALFPLFQGTGGKPQLTIDDVANQLLGQGVLAPSALTDEEYLALFPDCEHSIRPRREFYQHLEQIARG